MEKQRQDIRTYYSEEEWEDAIERSHNFAMKVLKHPSIAVASSSSEDLVSSAATKLLTGARTWKPEKYTLSQHLIHAVRSNLSHLLKINSRQVYLDNDSLDTVVWETSTPELVILKKQLQDQHQEIIQKILNRAKETNDNGVLKILEALMSGEWESKPADLAKATNLGIKDIYNAKKRLSRIAYEVTKDKEEVV